MKGFTAIANFLTAYALIPTISSMTALAQTFSSGIIALIFIMRRLSRSWTKRQQKCRLDDRTLS